MKEVGLDRGENGIPGTQVKGKVNQHHSGYCVVS